MAAVLLILVSLSWQIFLLRSEVYFLRRRVMLSRVITAGRTKSDIVAWLGAPHRIYDGNRMMEGRFKSILVYRSNPRARQGTQDIWIGLDDEDVVVAVYYPDSPEDRDAVSR